MTTFGLVLDCADPETLADFWAAALGYVTLGAAGSYVLLVAADGNQTKLLLAARIYGAVTVARSGAPPYGADEARLRKVLS
jgi:hypothetical protein